MPDPMGMFSILNTQVETGPSTAPARVGGRSIHQFFMIFDTCSMDVPIPCASNPPIPLSLYEITAKPIICAQHPAVAAPPAIPESPSIMHSAALEIGAVRASPTRTATIIPIQKGCMSVAVMIIFPSPLMSAPIPGPKSFAASIPPMMVSAGVTMISTFVSLEIALPSSAPIAAARNAPAGPPRGFKQGACYGGSHAARYGACKKHERRRF